MMTMLKTIKVVIIEDFRLIRLGIRYDLESSQGIDVIGDFESAEEGIEFIRKNPTDVVVLDLGLPGMDGIEAIRQLKGISPNTKVLILTSHEHEEEVIAAFAASANGYCLKTIDPVRFVEVVRMVADGVAWLDPEIAKVALSVFSRQHTGGFSSRQGILNRAEMLSERESEILKLMISGKSNSEIADIIHLSVHTVKSYVSSIFQKLEVNDRVQASVKAVQAGLISLT